MIGRFSDGVREYRFSGPFSPEFLLATEAIASRLKLEDVISEGEEWTGVLIITGGLIRGTELPYPAYSAKHGEDVYALLCASGFMHEFLSNLQYLWTKYYTIKSYTS